jgi:AcrR family transcriptional regulator
MPNCQDVSPKAPDPEIRAALLETAALLLARDGGRGLTTRRLAAEVGTSTMAVYTHFGSVEELRRAVCEEGFARLLGHMRSVRATRDPVADLTALGWAYCAGALAEPQLYRAIFLDPSSAEDRQAAASATFAELVRAIARCIDARRFTPGTDPESLATQVWGAAHGMICAVLARVLTAEEMVREMVAMTRNLYVGFGDARADAGASVERASRRMRRRAPAGARAPGGAPGATLYATSAPLSS